MNDTKWDELRLAMDRLKQLSPRWRTLDVENGHLSDWDGEWFYHFRNGGYKSIQWVEIVTESAEQKRAVLGELVNVHVPGQCIETGFRILGYVEIGVATDYLVHDA